MGFHLFKKQLGRGIYHVNNMYLALDFQNWEETESFIRAHHLQGVPVKVGMELFYREGPDVIKRLKEAHHPIFLDLKLHDIPTTVYRAMRNLASLDIDLVNIHALGGVEMMKQAKDGLRSGARSGHETTLIAVTILTSFDKKTMNQELLLPGELAEHAVHLAKMAKQSEVDGVVCSVHETESIKAVCGQDFLTVTPGIRLDASDQDDQKRIATPKYAREHHADSIVIGRSITKSENPRRAYERAIKEWSNGTQL